MQKNNKKNVMIHLTIILSIFLSTMSTPLQHSTFPFSPQQLPQSIDPDMKRSQNNVQKIQGKIQDILQGQGQGQEGLQRGEEGEGIGKDYGVEGEGNQGGQDEKSGRQCDGGCQDAGEIIQQQQQRQQKGNGAEKMLERNQSQVQIQKQIQSNEQDEENMQKEQNQDNKGVQGNKEIEQNKQIEGNKQIQEQKNIQENNQIQENRQIEGNNEIEESENLEENKQAEGNEKIEEQNENESNGEQEEQQEGEGHQEEDEDMDRARREQEQEELEELEESFDREVIEIKQKQEYPEKKQHNQQQFMEEKSYVINVTQEIENQIRKINATEKQNGSILDQDNETIKEKQKIQIIIHPSDQTQAQNNLPFPPPSKNLTKQLTQPHPPHHPKTPSSPPSPSPPSPPSPLLFFTHLSSFLLPEHLHKKLDSQFPKFIEKSIQNIIPFVNTISKLFPSSPSSSLNLEKKSQYWSQINYADRYGGAKILMKSSKQLMAINSILDGDTEKYMYTQSALPIRIIIALNQYIAVESVIILSRQMYSCITKEFKIEGKFSLDDKKWVHLGKFTAEDQFGQQQFYTEKKIFRYIRITILSCYGKWSYFTLTQIQIRGKSLLDDAVTEGKGETESEKQNRLEQESMDEEESQRKQMCQKEDFKAPSEQPHENNLIGTLISSIDSLKTYNQNQARDLKLLNQKVKNLTSVLETKTYENALYADLLSKYENQWSTNMYVTIISLSLSAITLLALICMCLLRRKELLLQKLQSGRAVRKSNSFK